MDTQLERSKGTVPFVLAFIFFLIFCDVTRVRAHLIMIILIINYLISRLSVCSVLRPRNRFESNIAPLYRIDRDYDDFVIL